MSIIKFFLSMIVFIGVSNQSMPWGWIAFYCFIGVLENAWKVLKNWRYKS